MVERITEERLVDLRIAHAECEPDDQCDGADLLAEVDRLTGVIEQIRALCEEVDEQAIDDRILTTAEVLALLPSPTDGSTDD